MRQILHYWAVAESMGQFMRRQALNFRKNAKSYMDARQERRKSQGHTGCLANISFIQSGLYGTAETIWKNYN